MTHAAGRARPAHLRHRVSGRRTAPVYGLPLRVSLVAAPPARPTRPLTRRARILRGYGRCTVIALPGYAAVELVVSLRGGVGLAKVGVLLGVLGLGAVSGLLAGSRGARPGLLALAVGIGGLVAAALSGPPTLSGQPPLPTGLLAGGFALMGVAVGCSRTLTRADGALLVIGAPALYLGGRFSAVTPIMAGLLLLAAAIGISRSAFPARAG